MTLAELQSEWNALYRDELPRLAKQRSAVQPDWPVFLDHCFSRIILDNAVGIDRPWTAAVKSPAVRNMTQDQLRRAIKLGRAIASGDASLRTLDEQSLALRGKAKGPGARKRKQSDGEPDVAGTPHQQQEKKSKTRKGEVADSEPDTTHQQEKKPKTRKGEVADIWAAFRTDKSAAPAHTPDANESAKLEHIRTVIANDASLTPFRRRVLTLLTQVPRGRWTTYKQLAAGVAGTDAVSSARAVGSAMRSNPFAPTAPCHRVLASDGRIGGFGGSWGDEGRFVEEKRALLRSEGVRFDGRGKVVGEPFTGFY